MCVQTVRITRYLLFFEKKKIHEKKIQKTNIFHVICVSINPCAKLTISTKNDGDLREENASHSIEMRQKYVEEIFERKLPQHEPQFQGENLF